MPVYPNYRKTIFKPYKYGNVVELFYQELTIVVLKIKFLEVLHSL